MKKLLRIVILGFFLIGKAQSFENFKPLTNLELKMHNSIEQLYTSIVDQNDKDCQISFHYNGFYTTEYLDASISESDFLSISNIKDKEFNIYCDKLVHKIKDSKKELVDHEYTMSLDVCGGKIYSYNIVFHLGYKTYEISLRPGFGKDPEILLNWVDHFNSVVKKKPEFVTEENSTPYKEDGKIYKSFRDSRNWKHNTIDNKGEIKYLVYLSSTIYRNDKLGPTMNRVSFSIRDNSMKRIRACS